MRSVARAKKSNQSRRVVLQSQRHTKLIKELETIELVQAIRTSALTDTFKKIMTSSPARKIQQQA